MDAGHAPRSAGLYFALGHSTVVVLATMLLAVGAAGLGGGSMLKTIGGLIGTSVSAGFLLAIAALNLVIFVRLWRSMRAARARAAGGIMKLDPLLAGRAVLTWLLSPAFRVMTKSWHMYPLGFLFGLGFDTATSVGFLGLSAAEAGDA